VLRSLFRVTLSHCTHPVDLFLILSQWDSERTQEGKLKAEIGVFPLHSFISFSSSLFPILPFLKNESSLFHVCSFS
jgi:hypothetical protein